jgi:UDP-N-acetylglucosamine transferase subunit ALG13
MILLTVGTQLPFDRFVTIVDRLAPTLPQPVFAQIGEGIYRPKNMEWRSFVGPIEFERRIKQCSYIISHAGIGTVVMAQKHRKGLILFPRLAALDEHRNDHQLATVRALGSRSGINVALDEAELTRLVKTPPEAPKFEEHAPERDRLCSVIATIVAGEQRRRLRGSRP